MCDTRCSGPESAPLTDLWSPTEDDHHGVHWILDISWPALSMQNSWNISPGQGREIAEAAEGGGPQIQSVKRFQGYPWYPIFGQPPCFQAIVVGLLPRPWSTFCITVPKLLLMQSMCFGLRVFWLNIWGFDTCFFLGWDSFFFIRVPPKIGYPKIHGLILTYHLPYYPTFCFFDTVLHSGSRFMWGTPTGWSWSNGAAARASCHWEIDHVYVCIYIYTYIYICYIKSYIIYHISYIIYYILYILYYIYHILYISYIIYIIYYIYISYIIYIIYHISYIIYYIYQILYISYIIYHTPYHTPYIILYILYYILCIIYYILYIIFYILYIIFYILYYILYIIYCTLYIIYFVYYVYVWNLMGFNGIYPPVIMIHND